MGHIQVGHIGVLIIRSLEWLGPGHRRQLDDGPADSQGALLAYIGARPLFHSTGSLRKPGCLYLLMSRLTKGQTLCWDSQDLGSHGRLNTGPGFISCNQASKSPAFLHCHEALLEDSSLLRPHPGIRRHHSSVVTSSVPLVWGTAWPGPFQGIVTHSPGL